MWYNEKGNENNTALMTKVTVDRNIAGYPFTEGLTDDAKKEITEKVKAALGDRMTADGSTFTDGTVTVTLFGKNVISVSAEGAGFCVKEMADKAYAVEELLDASIDMAFSERTGYITIPMSKDGTGLTVSTILHLPVFSKTLSIRELSFRLSDNGIYTSLTDAGVRSNLFEFMTSGRTLLSEDEKIESFEKVIGQVIEEEKKLRARLSEDSKNSLKEKAMRTAGIIMYCGKFGQDELVDAFTTLRLAGAAEIIPFPAEKADEMLFTDYKAADDKPIDEVRAEKLKEIIGSTDIVK